MKIPAEKPEKQDTWMWNIEASILTQIGSCSGFSAREVTVSLDLGFVNGVGPLTRTTKMVSIIAA